MKKLLLLDADVIIDLHTLGLFEKITKTYEVSVTRTVVDEARYFKREGKKHTIDITDSVTVISDVDIDSLKKVQGEAKEARLGIDPGELESIAYLSNAEEEVTFCTCDKAAIKLISYMELETKSMSVEKAVKGAGHHKKNLYPRHFEKMFEKCIKDGKVLRVQFKKLT
ncbi:MAG: hypothetical protein JRE40_06870 [Deltaproteobacteria bacterium]|nr:hypothetical protein [Deltaproteobacteria bacterium]